MNVELLKKLKTTKVFEHKEEIAKQVKKKDPNFDKSSLIESWCHEEKVFKYVSNNQVERVTVGTTDFQITQDSFKLIELDLEQ